MVGPSPSKGSPLPTDVDGGPSASDDICSKDGWKPGMQASADSPKTAERTLATVHAKACAATAGAVAGELLTTLMFYPIELIKSRLQATVQAGGAGGGYKYRGLAHGLLCVVKEEGVAGLFTGLNSVILRATTSEVAMIYASEFLLGCYRLVCGRGDSIAAVPLRTLGGWASVFLTLPFETVATRVTTTRPPISATAATRVLLKEGGLPALWSGLPVSLVLCLNPALMLSTVDWLRRLLFVFLRFRGQQIREEVMNVKQAMVVGAVAKVLTLSVIYPLMRGKVLLQVSDDPNAGIFQVLRWVFRNEGVQSLYQGLGAQMSKSIGSAAVKYAVKEEVETRSQQFFLQKVM